MAIPITQTWRIRAGGSNSNGAGFDPACSGVLSTTLTAGIAAGDTSISVASATGWPSSGNYYARLGSSAMGDPETPGSNSSEVVLVTAGQGTTTWTVTRGQLGTTGIAHASGAYVDNELTRCNTAPFTGTTNGSSTASTTFTATGSPFNTTVVGNTLWLASGTGATVGAYAVLGFTDANTITLDRASGTYTNGTWKIGGANLILNSATAAVQSAIPGNITYYRASGSATKSSPDYSVTTTAPFNGNQGDSSARMRYIGENGRPFIKATGAFMNNIGWWHCENFYLVAGAAFNMINSVQQANVLRNVIMDQNGYDANGFCADGLMDRCEFFSSVANGGAAGTSVATYLGGVHLMSCHIHDTWGHGVAYTSNYYSGSFRMFNTVIQNCKGNGVLIDHSGGASLVDIRDCTINNNGGHGIYVTSATSMNLAGFIILNNIISNHVVAGKYGISVQIGSTAANDRVGHVYNNLFYNNTADVTGITAFPSTGTERGRFLGNVTGVNPNFVDAANENLTPGAVAGTYGVMIANPQSGDSGMLQSKSGAAKFSTTPPVGALPPITNTIINSRATAHGRR